MSSKVYKIDSRNINNIDHSIQKLNKKAKKLSCPEIEYEVVDTEVETFEDGTSIKWVNIRLISDTIPKLNGWEFVAKLDHSYSPAFITTATDHSIPRQYINAESVCEHCNTNRARKITYIVKNDETGEMKQVGKSCLKDFLGHINPNHILHFFDMIQDFEYSCSGYNGQSCNDQPNLYGVKFILALTAKIAKSYGFTSKTAAEKQLNGISTATLINEYLFSKSDDFRHEIGYVDEGDHAFADKIIEHVIGLDGSKNDYYYSLKFLIEARQISSSEIGFLASAYGVYQSSTKQKIAYNNEYFGTIKKRQENKVTVLKKKYLESDYGLSVIYNMIDNENHAITWFSSSDKLLEGENYDLKMTVVNHDEYNGVKTTYVNRCAIVN